MKKLLPFLFMVSAPVYADITHSIQSVASVSTLGASATSERIGSSISGLKFGLDGYWTTWGTFAPQLIDKGKEATLEQIQIWYNNGITKDELEAKKSTITGTFKVSLDTTGGLVSQILSNVERSKEIKHLDQYPDIINNLKLDQVNNAIGKYIDPKKLTIVSAGSFNNK